MASSVTATFLFTDLVDSTATSARLGPDAAEEFRQTHFRLLRGAVVGSGGVEVKNLGDGLMVMYSSPSRALSGAAGMQQAVEHHNRTADEPLGVRIGLSVGEAVEEDGDYFGDPVVEAARLCAEAQGGQILATEAVRVLVGRHATQTFLELGLLALKGLPEPVATVEVVWEPVQVAGAVPLPARLVGAASDALFGFFGRGPELTALEEIRKRARSSRRCQAVFVAGEAGIGKTALVAQAGRAAHDEGAVVLFGHSDEGLGVAYQPWIELVSILVRHGDAEMLHRLRPAQRSALARLVPEVGDDGDRVADPDTQRLLLLEGATELLATAPASVFVVFDDLHWADAASLQLLRHVITSTLPMDVTVVCTYRETDLGHRDPLTVLLADLHREANVARLSLKGLEDFELVELMAAAAGHDLDDTGIGLAHAMRRETDGNPFFTNELLRHLGETGQIVMGDDGRWTVAGTLEELGLPRSVRDVVGRRVERLGDEARRLLSLAAVIGRDFDIELLARIADVDEDPLLDLLDAAVAAAVLTESGRADRYRFAHALIQHSLYDDLSPARRQRTHQRIAQALEPHATDDDLSLVAELARHWIAATRPTDLDKAVHYARRAGDLARNALAPDDAIRWYQQALDLLERQTDPDQHQRAMLLAALGTAQRQAAHPNYGDALVQAATLAEELGDRDALIQAALGFQLGMGSIRTVGHDDARRVVQAALDDAGRESTPTRARLLAELALSYDGGLEWQARRDMSIEAVDTARRAGNDAAFAYVVRATYEALAVPDRLDQQLADIETAVTIADRSRDPALQFNSRAGLMWAAYQRADIERAEAVLAELKVLAETTGLSDHRFQIAQFQVGRFLLRGDASEAEAANDDVLALGTAANHPSALSSFGGLLVGIRQHQGRLNEIADSLIQTARDYPSIPAIRSAIPAILCDVGRIEEAREWSSAEVANGFDNPYDSTWLSSMANATDTAATLGDLAASETLITRLTPFGDQVICIGGVRTLGALARPLARAAAVLRNYDQAEQWFETAHNLHARLQAPFWTARGQLDHADLCLARRANADLQHGWELATTAAATASEYGCAGLTRRAKELLATI
jgi:class 3 adenylate cyclase/tetratricopeptide (TPR) repeat protein